MIGRGSPSRSVPACYRSSLIIFGLRVTEFTGAAVIPIAGIIIGGAMTAHTLTARRAFDVLRS